MVDEEFVVTLDSQTFTLPAGSFIAKTGQFTCKKIAPTETEGGIASATFNFTKCSFTMTIKNTEIEAGSGTVDFCVAFAGYSQCVQVTLPTAPTRCTFTISPTAESFTAGGGDGSVTVTTSNGCAWTATSHASWIIITSGSSGSGSGTVGYSVAANGGTAERTGTMTISGHTFTVTQAKPTADIPSAPTGVTASAGDGQVSISWSAVSGATSYNIYWSTTSGVTKTNGTKITDATSPYSHTILTNGTTYYYIVTAVNSSGESMESAQVSATPTAVQDPPIKLFNAGVSPWINDIMEDSSNNILVAGTQDDGRSIVVLKLSSAGTQAWNKYFPAGTDVITNNIFEVPSQGYLVTGCIDSTSGSLFKMQLDTAGNQSAPDYFDCGLGFIDPGSSDSVMLSDGSVIFAGNTQYKDSCNTFIPYGNALITGINSSGMQYFRSDYDYAPGYSENFNSVIALSGGGFAAAGEADLYDNGDGYSGPYNAILIKTDSLGSVIWTQNYGYKTDDLGNDGVIDLIQTSDNGYAMLAKLGYNYDMYVIKTDSSGNSTAAFNAATGDSCYNGRKFVQSGDNGFVIAGQGSGCHGAVVKMSAAGVKVWEYNTDYNPTAIVKSASGGYLIAGDAYVDMGVYKIFVFKLDDLGKRVW
ncbi:MAG: BACON domain-containing carbohydrate-binding protein [Sedimentisphaerales bacterium]